MTLKSARAMRNALRRNKFTGVVLYQGPSMIDGAPIVVAKGSDFMAAQIREEAARRGIHMFPAPELARALYFTTEPEHPVPEALYHAVAQVIAYVFSLEGAQPGRGGMRRPSPKVPASMRFDAAGQRLEPAAA